jgi:hypothetical protein
MDGNDCLDAFQLRNHEVFHKQIDSIAQLKPYALINNRKSYLRPHLRPESFSSNETNAS